MDVFSDLIQKYESQITEFSAMRLGAEIGIVYVDSSKLKELLLPSPKHCRKEIEKLLPAIVKSKSQALLDELAESNSKISKIPTNVEEFVQIMAHMKKIAETQEYTNQR